MLFACHKCIWKKKKAWFYTSRPTLWRAVPYFDSQQLEAYGAPSKSNVGGTKAKYSEPIDFHPLHRPRGSFNKRGWAMPFTAWKGKRRTASMNMEGWIYPLCVAWICEFCSWNEDGQCVLRYAGVSGTPHQWTRRGKSVDPSSREFANFES